MLYVHFKQKFYKQIETFGRHKLEQEKESLRRSINHTKAQCIAAQVDNNILPKKDRLWGPNVMGYKIREGNGNKSCPYYTMNDISFLDYLRKNQENKCREKLKVQYHAISKFDGKPKV